MYRTCTAMILHKYITAFLIAAATCPCLPVSCLRGYHSTLHAARSLTNTNTNTYTNTNTHTYTRLPWTRALTGTSLHAKLPSFSLQVDWMQVFIAADYVVVQAGRLAQFASKNVDFSAGAGSISDPDGCYRNKNAWHPSNNNASFTGTNEATDALNQEDYSEVYLSPQVPAVSSSSPILRVHTLGKRLVRKLPDVALLGILVLISSELLKREVNSKSSNIPLIFRDVANTTVLELDSKIELLTKLQWNFDPFIQAELENLQTQPLEAIDKFLVTEVLPRVDKELSPVLSKLTTNPAQVKVITKNINDLIKLLAYLVLEPGKTPEVLSPFERTTTSIIEGVDYVGQSIEEAIRDWNMKIEDLGKIVKSESIIKLLPSSLLPSTSSSSSSSIGTSVGPSSGVVIAPGLPKQEEEKDKTHRWKLYMKSYLPSMSNGNIAEAGISPTPSAVTEDAAENNRTRKTN